MSRNESTEATIIYLDYFHFHSFARIFSVYDKQNFMCRNLNGLCCDIEMIRKQNKAHTHTHAHF